MFGPAPIRYRESSGHDCTRPYCVVACVAGCIVRSIPFPAVIAVPCLLCSEQLWLCCWMQSSVVDYMLDLHRVRSRITARLSDDSRLTVAQTTCARTASRAARMCAPTIAGAIVASDITPLMTADRGLAEISETLEKSLQAWTANDGWGKSCQYHFSTSKSKRLCRDFGKTDLQQPGLLLFVFFLIFVLFVLHHGLNGGRDLDTFSF